MEVCTVYAQMRRVRVITVTGFWGEIAAGELQIGRGAEYRARLVHVELLPELWGLVSVPPSSVPFSNSFW